MIIYDIDGKELLDVPVTSAATHEQELGKSDYVRLSWVSDVKQVFAVGSYITPFSDGLKYRLLEPYTPNQNNESEWKYEPEFQHPLMWLSKIPFTYTTVDKNKNMSYTSQDWPYLGLTTSLLQVVVDQINDLFGFTTEDDKFTFEIVGSVDTTVNVTFSSTDILSALTTIANACENNTVEWHISWENKCLYFGQIFFDQGENTPLLKVGENVGKVSVTSTKDGYYNVFFPQGSTRNISTRLTNGHYLASSLRLGLNFPLYDDCKYPDGTIDTRTNTNEPKQVLALTFDEVYPHVNCYVYNVRSRTETKLIQGSTQPQLDKDGNPIKYSIWYFRLAYPLTTQLSGKTVVATTNDTEADENGDKTTITHYWYDYFVDEDKDVVDGYKLCGQFTANTNADALPQPLLGQPTATEGFEMVCHQNDTDVKLDDGTTVKKGDFEVVYSESNDLIIPTTTDDGLYPRGEKTPSLTANEVILYNIVMTENEIRAAQDDLLVQTKKEIARRNQDLNNYSFPSYPSVFEGNNPNLYIGQKVNFDDNAGTTLATRIIKLSTKIDFPFEQTITVGNQKIKGNNSQLREDVRTIMSGNWSGGGLSATEARNLIQNFGSRYFLSRLKDDIASGLITFAKGLVSEAESTFKAAVSILSNLFVKGNADVEGELTVGGETLPYEQGTQGFKVEVTGTGARLQTDYLDVTKKLTAHEVTIQKVEHIGGKQISTAARMICSKVVTIPAGYSVVTGYKCSYSDAQTDVFLTEEPKDAANVTTAELSSAVELDASHVYFDSATGLIYTYDSATQKLAETAPAEGEDVEYCCFFEKEDSDGRQVYNLFQKDDLAYCQTFNIETDTTKNFANSYYWRKVTAAGDDYIQLSDYKKDPASADIAYDSNGAMLDGKVYGSTVPQSGDEIVLLGNISKEGRQGAIIQASADTWSDGDVPYFSIYSGIKSFVLPKAKLHFSPGSSWITGTDITLTATSGEVNLQEYINSLSDGLTDVKNQVDESFMIYQSDDPYLRTDGTYVPPTLDSEPASEWTTDELKAQHVGDFYLSSDGFCWKFVNNSGTYEWTLVVDKYLTAYVREIGEKKRVFTSQPTETSVYDIGDLWTNVTANGTDGNGDAYEYDNDMLVCVQAKASGEAFDFCHWQAANSTKTEIRAGFMTEDGVAELYSQYVNNGNIISEATIGTYIADGISKAEIKADQVEILSTNFKVIDGSVYAHDLTLTGALNNMRTVIEDDDLMGCEGAHTNESTIDGTSFKCFDLLCTGSIVSLQLESEGYVALPFCYGSTGDDQRYIRTKTRFNGTAKEGETKVSPHSITIAEMRMLVGKKLYVYNDGKQSPTVLVGRRVVSESDGVVVFDGGGSTGTSWVEESIPSGQYRIYECCLGCENLGTAENSAYYECIYWKPIGNVGSPLTEFDNETA